jgi:hypothetical protein
VISPLLCNVCVHRLDRAWDTRTYGVLVRYADDLLVMCRPRAQGQLFQPGGNCGAQGVDDRGHHGLSMAPIRVGIGGDDPLVDAPGHGDRDVAVVGEHAGQP